MSKFPQQRNAMLEWFGHGVIGVIMKALIGPERVRFRRNIAALASQPAKRGYTVVLDLMNCQRLRECVSAELRVSQRSRDRANIDDEPNTGMPQQIDKFSDGPGRMADGEERLRHRKNPTPYLFTR